MILRKLKLKNFRGYESVEVNFNKNLNVIIGRNDVGKSTILDALDIFFNDQRIDINDCNRYAEEPIIEISCLFDILDKDFVVLDKTNPTSLREEFLLNKENMLEVKKVINASGKTITNKNVSVYLNTYHPEIRLDKPLITLTQSSLRKILEDNKLHIKDYDTINKNKKAEMRKAIFSYFIDDDIVFKEKLIDITEIKEENMKTWLKLKESFPLFNLFQSDRANTDGDKEIQDPMKAITKEVLADLEEPLNQIRDEVVSRVEKVGQETIEKLKEFNSEIANQLITIPELKNWDSVFKFNLDTDNDIPLNKRGSGVRRLILLSYFRAQAEKEALNNDRGIIYAVEEPETSQHPDFQKMIINSLSKLSQKENNQVFITTHTPEIAQMVDENCLIMISKKLHGFPAVITDREVKIKEVVSTLGILPTIHASLVICVEGPNDSNFLLNINQSVNAYRDIIDLKNSDISIYELGGSRLIDFINKDHFEKSNIKEFHLFDGDVPKYKEAVEKINKKSDGRREGVITQLREMENYIPIELIEEYFDCDLIQHKERWREIDVPKHLTDITKREIIDHQKREQVIKRILNGKLTQRINEEMLRQHGVYEEIESWFISIRNMYESTTGYYKETISPK
ncbi:OLD family endonuclease [Bacillus subtilis]|nr:OLD family endonuclease [Bacillus cereus]POO73793.1 OLD family endonuclease [Bacillus subtilis]